MALLLGIRHLDPTADLLHSESSASLADPTAFRNHAFQNDTDANKNWSSTYPTVSISIPEDDDMKSTCGNGSLNNKSELLPGDSGLSICMNNNNNNTEDVSSIGAKSFDSGVFDSNNGHADETESKAIPPKKYSVSDNSKDDRETILAICIQVFIPFLIAGIGTCGAGIVLDYVEKWAVFKSVTEIFILVPTLLGLKGNLEMTLASRVSTQANLGKLESVREKWQMSWGNMSLIQCQATVMGLLAASFATVMSIAKGGFNMYHAMLLSASALFTAATASLVLGAITLAVVIISHKCHINPDNVATPIAASLGDVTTLGLLAAISSYLYQFKGNAVPSTLIVCAFLALVPVWGYLSYKNPYVKQVLYTGWLPVILAVVITSTGGYILELSVSQFKGFAIFQPVINGVAGNLVAVQASRISTYFHKNAKPGSRPADGSTVCVSPCAAFFGKNAHSRTALILMAMVIPGHLMFGYGITLVKGGDTVLTPSFLPIYLISAFIQIALLLYIAQCMIQILWLWKIDPDNSAIPLLTALGDLSGMACLTIAFIIHHNIFGSP